MSRELSQFDADGGDAVAPDTGNTGRTPDPDADGGSEPVAYRPLWREAAGVTDADTEPGRPRGGAAADDAFDSGAGSADRTPRRYIQGTVEPDTDNVSRPQPGDAMAGTSSADRPPAAETAGARETAPVQADWRLVGDSASLREPDTGGASQPQAGATRAEAKPDTGTASQPRPGAGASEADLGAADLPRRASASTVAGRDTNGGRQSAAGGSKGLHGVGQDRPLLGDAPALRASWQRVQAGFVDDPRGAVSDAADLVEHATQALVGALRRRQRELRAMWDGAGSADGGGAIDSTEEFRLLVQRYRALFNRICGP